MYVSEFRLFDRESRKLCNLKDFAEIIESEIKEIVPQVNQVFVGARRYLVVSEDGISAWQARKISEELFQYSSLAQWHGYNGQAKRLMQRTCELQLPKSVIKNLYYMIEEEEKNGQEGDKQE